MPFGVRLAKKYITMVNTEEFIKRLERLLDYYGLSASAFADKVGVQRSSISHLLAGRNKPSLEFVMKVINTFPEVNLYWLLNGKGAFPSPGKQEGINPSSGQPSDGNSGAKEQKSIEKVIILYSDGSFDTYSQK
jgi:transcriptional regulator with XRE-family HTH domain